MLRSPLVRAALVAALTALPAVATAQTCLGSPSFTANHLQLGADVNVAENATSFGAQLGSGSETVFASFGGGGVTYDNVDGSTIFVGGTLGYQVKASASGRAQVCPVLSASYGWGPNDIAGSGSDLTVKNFSFGLAFGSAMGSGEVALVPSASVAFVYSSASVDVFGGTFDGDDTYGMAGIGLGVLLNSQLSIRPSVSMPFGVEDAKPIYGIGVTLNYGGRR